MNKNTAGLKLKLQSLKARSGMLWEKIKTGKVKTSLRFI